MQIFGKHIEIEIFELKLQLIGTNPINIKDRKYQLTLNLPMTSIDGASSSLVSIGV